MATITTPSLVITNVNATTVNVAVSYTLTPTAIEKLAGSVFSEKIELIGDDPILDVVVSVFPIQSYAVNASTVNVPRTRNRNILKSTLNEDLGFESTGAEQVDEVFTRLSITYAANAPTVPTLPPAKISNTVKGAWKG
jgi:hypothetical protein